eukprot:TRINITY_DN20930_c0_g1_i1.p1 TRINITY_DN20930_c0_g1~~TRINITY_DN20930_c0_g1_i1.p1  ORF type:complete len:534 (-),score=65.68 TRINITY_DN20930_c0_g1_i1:123-1724(-)
MTLKIVRTVIQICPSISCGFKQRQFRKGFCYKSKIAKSMFSDPIIYQQPQQPHPNLYNQDFAPTRVEQRNYAWYDFCALWIGLVVSITSWYLAGSLVEMGMSWIQGIAVILFSNFITLIPMLLNSHPGTKYGIPFPVLVRSSFGIKGAHIPCLLRAMVAAGWYGIMTWVGATALNQVLFPHVHVASQKLIPFLDITLQQLAAFTSFWLFQVVIVISGMESIRIVEQYSAILLICLTLGLVIWAHTTAGGFGPMLSGGGGSSTKFLSVVGASITANVGYWATLSLNIPDFSRYARSQKDQVLGQALGLPPFMALFCFAGLAVTSSTIVIYGRAICDPVQLIALLDNVWGRAVGLLGLALATLTTNIAANVVAPANAIVNLAPHRISFVTGGLVAAAVGFVIMPWKLISSTQGFIFTWLVGYSALLGPIAGILIADYYIIRKRSLDIDSLYSYDSNGQYWYQGGYNMAAVTSMIVGIVPCIPGFLESIGALKTIPQFFSIVYQFAWFVGFFISIGVYCLLMYRQKQSYSQLAYKD